MKLWFQNEHQLNIMFTPQLCIRLKRTEFPSVINALLLSLCCWLQAYVTQVNRL